ncbi:MAG: ATPase [Mangrovicoccus sp.]|nr:ATPase [Mangrovicoccus sp.]
MEATINSPVPRPTREDWLANPRKRVLLFGMSGLGKTHISNLLRGTGKWFHYSVDYRIGTRYMGEYIVDNFKREAMRNPFLAQLLLTDSIYIASNLTFHNLTPLSTYLGKPGDPAKGGIPFEEYLRRQEQHRVAEIAALGDSAHFIARAEDLYGYGNFICDTGGSICEVVDPNDPNDPLLTKLSKDMLMVWLKGDAAHTEELIRRFDADPKPMYYEPGFLNAAWEDYRAETGQAPDKVDPDQFVRWAFAHALAHRQPRYEAMAKNWGITLPANDISQVDSAQAFETVIADTLASHGSAP